MSLRWQVTPPELTLHTVAHEWTHTELFASPLGLSYGASAEAQAINETSAELVGAEIGDALAQELGPPSPPTETAPPTGPSLQSQLAAVRIRVDQLLAEGQVDGAEAYMEQAREELVAQGYRIRRLNQAYFAFNGNYGQGAAGSTELPDRLHALRASSANLGDYLARVSRITSLAELRAATPEVP